MTTPVRGSVAVIKSGTTVVPGKQWKLTIDPNLKDVSNFADGRAVERTLDNADLTCTVVVDSTALPIDPAGLNLVRGALVTAKLYVTATQFYSVPVKVGKCDFNSEVEGILMFDFEGKLHGTITDPVIT